MFCPDYEVITQTQEGGCPKHSYRKKAESDNKDNDAGDQEDQKEGESSKTGQ
jgi:hypothetical protein